MTQRTYLDIGGEFPLGQLPWECACGWSGHEPEQHRTGQYHGPGKWRAYVAPLCPKCGSYFNQAAIDRAEAIRPGCTLLPRPVEQLDV